MVVAVIVGMVVLRLVVWTIIPARHKVRRHSSPGTFANWGSE